MLASMRRLHPRGPDCRRIAVDADGATLGPDCMLVRRTPAGFRCLDPAAADALQKAALGFGPEPDWLFEQCRRIAEALVKGDVALAQIDGLRIPIGDLDDAALRKLAATARLIKAGFDPNQPRVPAGNPDGGQWTDAGGSQETSEGDVQSGLGGEAGDGSLFPSEGSSGWPADDLPPEIGGGGADRPSIEYTVDLPEERPDTAKERNSIVRRSAEWLREAAALGAAFAPGPRVKAFFIALEATARVVEYLPEIRSYLDAPRSLGELQDAAADRRLGYQIHHIVEGQYGSRSESSNAQRFGTRLEAAENLVSIPKWKHIQISSWYSRGNDAFGGMTPRAYLRGKNWEEQYKIGLRALRIYGVLK